MDDSFSYDRYRAFLLEAEESHGIISFRDVYRLGEEALEQRKRYLILRHDIDFDVEAAHRMAQIEHEVGVSSTYAFLFSGGCSPLGRLERTLIHEMVAMDHDIALHFDWSLVQGKRPQDTENLVMAERRMLEVAFNVTVHAISSHEPMRSQTAVELGGLIDTYAPPYTATCKYLSDSTRTWREAPIEQMLPRHDRIQLLIHPIWWGEEDATWQQRLRDLASTRSVRNREYAESDIAKFSEGLKLRAARDAKFDKVLRAGGGADENAR